MDRKARQERSASVVVDRIEEGLACLQFSSGLSVLWPEELLPDGSKEGSTLRITLAEDKG